MKAKKLITYACIALAVVGTSLVFTNCKKKSSSTTTETPTPTPVPLTNTQKLCDKNFKVTAITVNPGLFDGNATITDVYASSLYASCYKDNISNFKTNGTYTEDEGTVVCSGNAQTTAGTWLWNTNETILTVTTGTDVSSMTIITNDGTTLKGTETTNISGTNYVFTYTYVKQ